jgi:MYXO-CTERM domain-containing protein
MRSNLLGMCSAVAAVAVAGSAGAGVVDPFTTTQSFSGASTNSFTNITGGLFGQREARRVNVAGGDGVNGTSNNVAFTLARAGTSPSTAALNYRNSSGTQNLSSLAGMSIALSDLVLNLNTPAATGVTFTWYLYDVADNEMSASQTLFANGTSVFDFAAATTDVGFDLTQVALLSVQVSQFGGSTSGSTVSVSGTLSNFSYTAVPAPGALALLGAAGLVGARRRRN